MIDRLVLLAIWALRPVEWWHARRVECYNTTHHGRPVR